MSVPFIWLPKPHPVASVMDRGNPCLNACVDIGCAACAIGIYDIHIDSKISHSFTGVILAKLVHASWCNIFFAGLFACLMFRCTHMHIFRLTALEWLSWFPHWIVLYMYCYSGVSMANTLYWHRNVVIELGRSANRISLNWFRRRRIRQPLTNPLYTADQLTGSFCWVSETAN